MKSIPVSSILYFLLSLGVLFVNANTFTDSQIFPKWIFMFAGGRNLNSVPKQLSLYYG